MTHPRHLARRRNKEHEEGFTLIELLVVVLIIGILAAIAIPVFLGQQNQAYDASSKSDLETARVAEISYKTANDGSTTSDVTLLAPYGYNDSSTSTIAGVMLSTVPGNFCISEKSASGTWFATTQDDAVGAGYCGANAVMRHYQPSFA